MKVRKDMLVDALWKYAETNPERAPVLRRISTDLENDGRLSVTLRDAALLLLDINDVPAELWTDPLPDPVAGADAVSDAVEMLNREWGLTPLHRLVAARRLAWAAAQLARSIENNFTEGLHKQQS